MSLDSRRGHELTKTLCLFLFLCLLAACSKRAPTISTDSKPATVALRVSLEESSQLDSIAYLVLTVTGRGMDTIRETVGIENGSFEFSLSVPAGRSREFTLEAKNAQDRTLYRGRASADLNPGQTLELEINLIPAVLMLRMVPERQSVWQDDPCTLQVEVWNAQDLFGASFRIEFDQNRLESVEVDVPDTCILGPPDSVISFDTSGTGYAAVGITRKYPAEPVSASGVLVQLSFVAVSPGMVNLSFVDTTLKLINQDGSDIPDFSILIVNEAQIEITEPPPLIPADFTSSVMQVPATPMRQSYDRVDRSYGRGGWKLTYPGARVGEQSTITRGRCSSIRQRAITVDAGVREKTMKAVEEGFRSGHDQRNPKSDGSLDSTESRPRTAGMKIWREP